MGFPMSELKIRRAVRERYSKIAESSQTSRDAASSCCGGSSLISLDESLPAEALAVDAGCGSPLTLITLEKGDVVLDLGSGGGIDVFRASAKVGPRGKAIGVDDTPEMVWRARETKAKYGARYSNVEFRLGEIEHLPIESGSVDYIISNCVINLVPDKLSVFKESHRALRRGGVFAVADVTLQDEISEEARNDMDSWSACIAGALTDEEYTRALKAAGFSRIQVEHVSDSNIGKYPFRYYSSHIKAVKA